MTPELKQKWIDALRSGTYRQGTGQLRNDARGFCCIGVLCDVSGLGTWRADCLNPTSKSYVIDGVGMSGGLNREYRVPFGISDAEHAALVRMNDTEGAKFPVIADYIEKHL